MNAIKFSRAIVVIIFALYTSASLKAQDRIFTYTYQSNVLGKGQREIESWNTIRAGREDFYLRYDNRTEFEVGLGSNLQTAFYLNLSSKTQSEMDDTIRTLATENEIGFSNEWKLKLLDPVANPVGLALYAEIGVASNEFDVEGKVILDKRAGDFTIAFNGVYEYEFAPFYKKNELDWTSVQKLEGYLACGYAISPRFQVTIESALKSLFEDGTLTQSALCAGPGFSYNQEKFWVNLTALPQLVSFDGTTNNNLNLNEYEKVQVRLLFSYMF